MKKVTLDYSWTNPYTVLDDFFEPDEFETVKGGFASIDKTFNPRRVILTVKCAFDMSGQCIYNNSHCTEKNLRSINTRITPILLNILEELAPHKVEQAKYIDWGFQTTPKSLIYSIHPDIPEKLLSTVVYCRPEENFGTFLYSNRNGDNRFEIPWKPNRALIFSKAEDTWHSYSCNDVQERYALILNVLSNIEQLEPE